jgi:ribonuclease Z
LKVFFLGTGAGVPAKLRNVSSIALKLLEERGAIWLFDCGEATQHQILHTTIKPRRIEKIFITHLHGDHIFGLPGLLGSRSFQGGTDPLTVYGPKGIQAFIETSLAVSETHLKYPLHIVEIDEGTIFEDEQFVVEARRLDHAILSYGFRIVEKDRPGELQADKLQAEGIPPGPIYKRLKNGETVQLDDGRVICGKDYLGSKQKGKVVTILGDSRPCENARILAENADLLVHEATFAKDGEEMAFEYFHSTTTQAASLAKEARVSRLVLTHISSRYGKEDWSKLASEAMAIFPNTAIAEDFSEFLV